MAKERWRNTLERGGSRPTGLGVGLREPEQIRGAACGGDVGGVMAQGKGFSRTSMHMYVKQGGATGTGDTVGDREGGGGGVIVKWLIYNLREGY